MPIGQQWGYQQGQPCSKRTLTVLYLSVGFSTGVLRMIQLIVAPKRESWM